uniref:Protein translocase subunit SecY n=1 Tax=Schizocladia ischiensis TaxID=196139 RepID=A0A7S6U9Y3_9STRA|nr:SecY [Schizocladia ischiensis]QOW07551.1 SecY [Schizocladia ischiensis]
MNLQLRKKTSSIKQRFLLTVSLLTIVRIGSFIPVPYIDHETFATLLKSNDSSTTEVAEILKVFSGGGPSSFGLLSLGILPYINASIIIQLLTTINPSLKKLQKEEGEFGRRKITDYTRYLTFFCAIFESIGTTYSFRSLIFNWNFGIAFQIVLTLTTGSMIVLWFSELITKDGLGNGSSLLICFNIVSNLPDQILELALILKGQNIFTVLLLASIFLSITICCVIINEAELEINVLSASQLLRQVNKKSLWGKSKLPLRVNQTGVMPLVFTSSVMIILSSITKVIFAELQQLKIFTFLNSIGDPLIENIGKIFFWLTYSFLVFFFTSFYSKIVLDPKDIAKNFRKNSVTIQGIPAGLETEKYLSRTLKHLTQINAIFLISTLLLLNGLDYLLPIKVSQLKGFGFTSQLILVNIIIDTIRKIFSYLSAEENLLDGERS